MIQKTRWRLLTCTCIVIYQWDDTEPAGKRTQKIYSVENSCDKHKGLKLTDHWTALLEDTRRKAVEV